MYHHIWTWTGKSWLRAFASKHTQCTHLAQIANCHFDKMEEPKPMQGPNSVRPKGQFTLELRASSDLAGQAERPNPKRLSKGEDRSPLKYIISVLLSNSEYFIEKKFGLSTRVCICVHEGPKLLSRGQIFGAKSTKKCCRVDTL